MNSDTSNAPSAAMPDEFDRLTGALDGVGVATQPAIVAVVPALGVGGTAKYIVRTVRAEGDYLFVEMLGRDRSYRLVFPPAVTDVIARQRDALTAKNRRKGARQAAQTRKAAGITPFARKNGGAR